MSADSTEVRLSIPDDVVYEILDGEAVVLSLKTGTYFTLNPVGTRIWQLIQDQGILGRVRAVMLQEFDVELQVLDADIASLVSKLLEKGLIRYAEAQP